tara:strand:+ start:120 stop:605 length:486 start_codon:yes stop_codon:yes gene_type:complete
MLIASYYTLVSILATITPEFLSEADGRWACSEYALENDESIRREGFGLSLRVQSSIESATFNIIERANSGTIAASGYIEFLNSRAENANTSRIFDLNWNVIDISLRDGSNINRRIPDGLSNNASQLYQNWLNGNYGARTIVHLPTSDTGLVCPTGVVHQIY